MSKREKKHGDQGGQPQPGQQWPQKQGGSQPGQNWPSSRFASSSTSRRTVFGRGSNGLTSMRPPWKRQVPATAPSTMKVGTECGVFVLKTSGR